MSLKVGGADIPCKPLFLIKVLSWNGKTYTPIEFQACICCNAPTSESLKLLSDKDLSEEEKGLISSIVGADSVNAIKDNSEVNIDRTI